MGLVSIVGLATGAFVGTNIDNGLVTTAQLATAPPHRVRRIVAGQYTGFVIIVALAAAGAAVLVELPLWAVGLLGLVPIGLGLRGLVVLWRHRGRPAEHRDPIGGGYFSAALITVGNGGDNLAVYIPLFRQAGPGWAALAAVWMLVLDVGLCALAVLLGRHHRTLGLFERVGAWLTPAVYLVIGVVVLVRAGTVGHLT